MCTSLVSMAVLNNCFPSEKVTNSGYLRNPDAANPLVGLAKEGDEKDSNLSLFQREMNYSTQPVSIRARLENIERESEPKLVVPKIQIESHLTLLKSHLPLNQKIVKIEKYLENLHSDILVYNIAKCLHNLSLEFLPSLNHDSILYSTSHLISQSLERIIEANQFTHRLLPQHHLDKSSFAFTLCKSVMDRLRDKQVVYSNDYSPLLELCYDNKFDEALKLAGTNQFLNRTLFTITLEPEFASKYCHIAEQSLKTLTFDYEEMLWLKNHHEPALKDGEWIWKGFRTPPK